MKGPTGLLVLDTNIYIHLIYGQDYGWLRADMRLFYRCHLTAVVAAELYAGTRSQEEKKMIDRWLNTYLKLDRFSAPPTNSWIEAGTLIARASRTIGQINFVNAFRDVLIALETVRLDATLVTENTRDFLRWQPFIRASSNKKLVLLDPSRAEPGGQS
jgi:predicted nucleic acid-binding protein